MFNAGMAVGYYKLDSSDFEAGAKRVEKSNESMTTSMVKAGVILEAIKVGLQSIVNVGKSFIQSASNLENLNAEFKVMLGSANAAKNLVADIRELGARTPFNTEDLARASKTLLQFGIDQKEVIQTMTMLGDVAGNSKERLQSLSLVFGQISSAGKLQGQDLLQLINVGFNPLKVMADKTGESMASLRDRMSKGQIGIDQVKEAFISATSEGGLFYKNMETQSQTLSGLQSTLADNFNMVASTIGSALLPVLKDGVKEISDMILKVGEFVESAEGISIITKIVSNISGGISALKTMFGEVVSAIEPVVISIRDNLLVNMEKLGLKINSTNTFIAILTGASNILSATFRVVGVVINGIITNFANMAKYTQEFVKIYPLLGTTVKDVFVGIIDVIGKTINLGKKLFEALTDPFNATKWKNAGTSFDGLTKSITDNFKKIVNDGVATASQIGKAIDAGSKFVTGGADGIKAVIEQMGKEIVSFGADSQKTYDKLMEAYKSGMIKTQKDLDDFFATATEESGKEQIKATQQTLKVLTDEQKKALEEWGKLHRSERENAINDINAKADSFKGAGIAEIEVNKWKNDEIKKLDDAAKKQQVQDMKEKIGGIIGYIKDGLSSLGSIISTIGQSTDQYYSDQLTKLTDYYDGQKDILSTNYEDQKALDEEKYNSDIAALDSQLANKEITQVQYDERKKALDEATKNSTKNLDKKYKADTIKLEKEQLDKENELKKKQFENNKAFTIANIWINAALAVMGFWASLASMGVAGIALAAVATAATLVVAGIQTGMVASQEFIPARELGGDVQAGQPYITGEKGAEMFVPKTSGYIYNANQTRDFFSSSRATGGNTININNPIVREEMDIKKIAQAVNDELGKVRE